MDCINNVDILNNMPWLSQKRKDHIASTAICAGELAVRYCPELENKAFIAGMYHDCAKGLESELLKKYDIGIFADYYSTAHAPLGAMLARDAFFINDEQILQAIYWHCTGRSNMSTLEKIVFLAYAIEPLREYPNVDKIRSSACISLDDGVFAYLDNLVSYLKRDGIKINPYTLQLYNDYLTSEV